MCALSNSERSAALELLGRAPVVRIAWVLPDGTPTLRTAHVSLLADALLLSRAVFRAEPVPIGRMVIAYADEILAIADRVYHVSVEVRGTLAAFDEDRLRLPLQQWTVHEDVGREQTAAELAALMEALWRRGHPDDARAIERLRAAHPSAPTPAFLELPHGLRAHCALGSQDDVDEASALLRDQYWTVGMPPETLAGSHAFATAWVGAREPNGRLVATARAVSDVVRTAWIHDVIVAPDWRRRGLATSVMKLLLDHPALRRASTVKLKTMDAQDVYRKLGFTETANMPQRFANTEMTLSR